MITVALTVSCRRPRYLRRTLDSWARVRGITGTRLLLALEPPTRDFDLGAFRNWVRSFPAAEVQVSPAAEQLGCSRNTRRAMGQALDGSDFAVLAEEDTEVASDILEYYEWAAGAYRDDAQVLAVCAHVKESASDSMDGVIRAPWFSPIGWGTWADRWENLLSEPWRTYTDSWDALVRTVCSEQSLACVFPVRSRTQHFGEASTLTPRQAGGAPNYFHRTALSSCFSPAYWPRSYREMQADVTLY